MCTATSRPCSVSSTTPYAGRVTRPCAVSFFSASETVEAARPMRAANEVVVTRSGSHSPSRQMVFR